MTSPEQVRLALQIIAGARRAEGLTPEECDLLGSAPRPFRRPTRRAAREIAIDVVMEALFPVEGPR